MADAYWTERMEPVEDDGRRPYERDYARILHSSGFRRLQAKTQVFGIGLSDFYRTRLTHSLEVSQIGEGISRKLKKETADKSIRKHIPGSFLIRAICLAHDMGHPPFGHCGEWALNRCMLDYGGFEGNGQTLRILTNLEKYHRRLGMNLCRKTLLGVIKYPAPYRAVKCDEAYPEVSKPLSSVFNADGFKPPKCYLDTEIDEVEWITEGLEDWERVSTEFDDSSEDHHKKHKKTLHQPFHTSIMNVADDIAYRAHDLEDAISLSLLEERDFRESVDPSSFEDFFDRAYNPGFEDMVAKLFSRESYERKLMFRILTTYCINQVYLDSENPHGFKDPMFMLQAKLHDGAERLLGQMRHLVKKHVIDSYKVQRTEFEGQRIITDLFLAISSCPERMLPSNFTEFLSRCSSEAERMRVICDYIAGMTDEYAIRCYDHFYVPHKGSIFDNAYS